jgi:DNA-binding Lrp family transcriptional regulator
MDEDTQALIARFMALITEYESELKEDPDLTELEALLTARRRDNGAFKSYKPPALTDLPPIFETQAQLDYHLNYDKTCLAVARIMALLEPVDFSFQYFHPDQTYREIAEMLKIDTDELKEHIQRLIDKNILLVERENNDYLSFKVSSNSDLILRGWLWDEFDFQKKITPSDEAKDILTPYLQAIDKAQTRIEGRSHYATILKRIAQLELKLGLGYPIQTYFLKELKEKVSTYSTLKVYFLLGLLTDLTDTESVIDLCRTIESVDYTPETLVNRYLGNPTVTDCLVLRTTHPNTQALAEAYLGYPLEIKSNGEYIKC